MTFSYSFSWDWTSFVLGAILALIATKLFLGWLDSVFNN